MIPPRRLATLLDQARRHQQQTCLYHDESGPSSLYVDHECSSGQFPSMTTHILADHSDEVWNIVWSPDGMMLASCGKDKVVVIWQLKVCHPLPRCGSLMLISCRLRPRRAVANTTAWRRYAISSTKQKWTPWLGLPIARCWFLPPPKACPSGMSRWVHSLFRMTRPFLLTTRPGQ